MEDKVTIHNLEVKFDVEGDGDEAVFAKLFSKYANRWTRQVEEEKLRTQRSMCERSLGDRDEDK